MPIIYSHNNGREHKLCRDTTVIALHSHLWKMTIYYCCVPLLLLQVQSEFFGFMTHISHIRFGQWKSSIQLEKKRSLKYLYIQENHFIPEPLLLHGVRTNFFLAAGQDYCEVSPRIVHFPGEAPHTSLQCITIKILDDEEFEGEKPESFSLSLSVYNIAVVVNTSSATVFIVDDESDGGTSVG